MTSSRLPWCLGKADLILNFRLLPGAAPHPYSWREPSTRRFGCQALPVFRVRSEVPISKFHIAGHIPKLASKPGTRNLIGGASHLDAASQNVGHDQPPDPGFFPGTGTKTPPCRAVAHVVGKPAGPRQRACRPPARKPASASGAGGCRCGYVPIGPRLGPDLACHFRALVRIISVRCGSQPSRPANSLIPVAELAPGGARR